VAQVEKPAPRVRAPKSRRINGLQLSRKISPRRFDFALLITHDIYTE
jgi:hypothetical protein